MKGILEAAARADVFRSRSMLGHIVAALPEHSNLDAAYRVLTSAWAPATTGTYVFLGIIRWSFLIELVKAPKIETTKFEVRWVERLPEDDPRYAPYEECAEMALRLAEVCVDALGDSTFKSGLEVFARRKLIPYELPLDYVERTSHQRMHTAANVTWLWSDEARRTLLLRDYLLSDQVAPHLATFQAAYDKVKVKTYLTDRVLTGLHKTNREKRWETHPASVHYALRRDCLETEHSLMEQLFAFSGFPSSIKAEIARRGLANVADDPYRCPVTLEPLSFDAFESEIIRPIQGKSSFQVGHLNPLKAVNDDPQSGHTALNVSWMSADGNRIQGSLTLAETRELIGRIAANYGWSAPLRATSGGSE